MKRGIILFVVTLFLLLVIIMPFQTFAATYYVSTSGVDANPGTESEPWQSLFKASTSINEGDTILLNRGDTWLITHNKRNSLDVGMGLYISNDDVVIGAYGSGDKPIIDATAQSYVGDKRSTQAYSPIEIGVRYGHASSNVMITDVDVRGPHKGQAIQAYSSGDNLVIKNCEISGAGWEEEFLVYTGFDSLRLESNFFNAMLGSEPYSKSIEINGGDGHIIRNNTFKGYGTGGGLRFSNNGTGALIENNFFYDPDVRSEWAWALVIRSCDGGTYIVRNNVFDMTNHGSLSGTTDLRGIASWYDYFPTTRLIYNNVFISENQDGAAVEGMGGHADNIVKMYNNIIVGVDVGFNNDNSNLELRNNIFFDSNSITENGNEGLNENTINTDPNLVNPSMSNHIAADTMIGSPSDAIDGGYTSDSQIPNEDYSGNARDNNPDIGAFEFEGGSQSNPAKECENWETLHPEWILCEDWETGVIDSDKWGDGQRSGINHIVTTEKLAGEYALEMIHENEETGGYLNSIWSDADNRYDDYLDHGFDHLYARWYSKLSDEFDGTGTKLAGFSVKKNGMSDFWSGHTGAGIRPDGNTNGGGFRIVTGSNVGPNDVGEARFYIYHPLMMVDRWDNGGLQCKYYGDATSPPENWVDTPGAVYATDDYYCDWDTWSEFSQRMGEITFDEYTGVERHLAKDEWHCIEAEFKLNSPNNYDSELRYWLNDELAGEITGLLFRKHEDMDIKLFQLTGSSGTGHGLQHSYFDNVVISTERIGCLGTIIEPEPEPDQCTDADLNEDGEISNDEMDDYITLWIDGDVSIAELFDVIDKWKDEC